MIAQNIILNDTFQTKQISPSNLVKSCEGYQDNINLLEKELLSFEINDIQHITIIPGAKEYSVANYTFNTENPDPTSSINGAWSRRGSGALNIDNNVGLPDTNLSGIMVNSKGRVGNILYTKEITEAERQQFKYTTGRGYQEFSMALLNHNVTRDSPFLFTPVTGTDYITIKNKGSGNYIEAQVYDGNNLDKYLKYIIFFSLEFGADESVAINVRPHNDGSNYKIPNWDGQSLKKFKLEYSLNELNESFGTFYYEENNQWKVLVPNLTPVTSASGFLTYGCSFGNYYVGYDVCSSIVVNYMKYSVFSELDAICKINEKTFDSFYYFIDYCKKRYSYNISGAGSINIEWFFNDKNNILNLSDGKIEFDENWFPPTNYQEYYYFSKKQKSIKVIADKGSITSFINPSKYIYEINLGSLLNLDSINLSDNLLAAIDLSQNKLIKNIDLSNNITLQKVILPMGNNIINSLNLSNTLVNNLELINTKSTLQEVSLILDNLNKLESLTLRGIKVINPDIFVNTIFPNIKTIDISESNILTNKANLELFLNNLPNRTNLETGIIYLYGKKYISSGKQGSSKDIAFTLETLKNKNWLFYL